MSLIQAFIEAASCRTLPRIGSPRKAKTSQFQKAHKASIKPRKKATANRAKKKMASASKRRNRRRG